MNIPARYCTGYLGDIGVPIDPAPMDFSAWFEVYLDGRWYTFDARHNQPRIGRIVIARGRDAADVAISTSFGPAQLLKFEVITYEVTGERRIAGFRSGVWPSGADIGDSPRQRDHPGAAIQARRSRPNHSRPRSAACDSAIATMRSRSVRFAARARSSPPPCPGR